MEKLIRKKMINSLSLLFAFTYMVSYITRINYGAVIVEMESATGFSKSMLSMAVTGSFITYGVGQIISGIIGDRISPKRLVTYGLCLTVLMNFLIPICTNPYQMLGVWCVNGFAQSFMWPPLVRLMTALLSAKYYKQVTSKVIMGGSLGTVAVYLISPILISFFGWKSVFIFAAICGAVTIVIWNKFSYDVGVQKNQEDKQEVLTDKKYALLTPLMIFIMVAIILQGMLRDGITTWMPSYISETYKLGNEISILTGVVLPVFGVLFVQYATKVYMKWITNPVSCAALFFGVSAVSAVAIYLLTGKSVIASVVLTSVLTGCMYGVNLMLICMIPQFFKKSGRVSTISGIMNSCAYIGSAVSTYGMALLSEKFGWSFTLLSWLVIAALGTVICLICKNAWKKRFE